MPALIRFIAEAQPSMCLSEPCYWIQRQSIWENYVCVIPPEKPEKITSGLFLPEHATQSIQRALINNYYNMMPNIYQLWFLRDLSQFLKIF